MSLDEARATVANLKEKISHYVDPAAVPHKKDTFEKVAKEWLNKFAKTVTKKSFSLVKGRLNTYLFPNFGNLSIQDVTASIILKALQAVEKKGHANVIKLKEFVIQ